MFNQELYHDGTKGMRWGVRRYQNKDGSLTEEGKLRYRRLSEKNEIRKIKAETRRIKAEERSEKRRLKAEVSAEKKKAKIAEKAQKLLEKSSKKEAKQALKDKAAEMFITNLMGEMGKRTAANLDIKTLLDYRERSKKRALDKETLALDRIQKEIDRGKFESGIDKMSTKSKAMENASKYISKLDDQISSGRYNDREMARIQSQIDRLMREIDRF